MKRLVMLLCVILVLSGCSTAALDTRYIRQDQGATYRGPENQGSSAEHTRTITVHKAGGAGQ